MAKRTKEEIMELVKTQNVRFIRLQFTDILGTLKNVAITPAQLEKALNNEMMFDGSSIEDLSASMSPICTFGRIWIPIASCPGPAAMATWPG